MNVGSRAQQRVTLCWTWKVTVHGVNGGTRIWSIQTPVPHRIHHALSHQFQLVLATVYLDLGTYWCWCWEYSSQSSHCSKESASCCSRARVCTLSVPISMTLCFPGSQALCSQSLSVTFPVSIFFLFMLHLLPASLNILLHWPVCDHLHTDLIPNTPSPSRAVSNFSI